MNIDDDFNDHATHVPREETPSDTSYLTYILLGWGNRIGIASSIGLGPS